MDLQFIITMTIFCAFMLFCMIWFIKGLFNMARGLFSIFDRSIVPKNAELDMLASIVDVDVTTVQYTKNGAKYMTTVTFSDGFKFITHESEREDHFLTYKISISPELCSYIIQSAQEAHDRAFKKQQKRKRK